MPPRHGPRGRHNRRRKGEFKVEDPTVTHTSLAGGIWDLYEEENPALAYVPGSSRLELFNEMLHSLPYMWMMVKDVASLRSCWFLFVVYLALEVVGSLLPAVNLWYSGQILEVVQRAVDERVVDKSLLFQISAIRLGCSILTRYIRYAKNRTRTPLLGRIQLLYSVHLFHSNARLDVPTYDDPQVQQQLEQAVPNTSSRGSVAWASISLIMSLFGTLLQVGSQMSVLMSVLRAQRDGPLLAAASFAYTMYDGIFARRAMMSRFGLGRTWAATTKNQEYIRSEGLKQTITGRSHRKEIVAAGDMWGYLLSEYRRAVETLGENAIDFWTAYTTHQGQTLKLHSFLSEPLQELPQIVFTLRAIQYPISVPVSLASLNLITGTTEQFAFRLIRLLDETGSIAETFAAVRKLYEVASIPNKIQEGSTSYPENAQSVTSGISLEFRNVSFQYPGSTTYALQNVSFTIQKGQLCVIVGTNGSGKSTILKLITRLYDPTEGEIYIDGLDIRALRLEDFRKAMACLFQDYTHFPLNIKDNIGVGDPANAHDLDRIKEAAVLGGADIFVEKLPEAYDTYLERPVSDHYSNLPDGTKQLFGREVDHSRVLKMGGMSERTTSELSGGQMQRIALSRCFMKTLVSESSQHVGLLLFDEPSASLDPKAEHDLFQRLRQLRGQKTMLFSSHRFGNLTRHADVILYMDDSRIIETGTHEELLNQGGAYAEIWQLSAASFLN